MITNSASKMENGMHRLLTAWHAWASGAMKSLWLQKKKQNINNIHNLTFLTSTAVFAVLVIFSSKSGKY